MNIFDDVIEQQTTHDNEATAAIAKKQMNINDQVREMSSIFHEVQKDKSDKEPDWHGLLLNAKDATQKMRIRAAREQWQEDQKVRAFEEQQAAFDAKVEGLMATPQHKRNKWFYEQIQKDSPSTYFDFRIQKMKQKDKATLGLAFHLKG